MKIFQKFKGMFAARVRALMVLVLSSMGIGGVFEVECFGPDGSLKWRETCHNLVPTIMLNHILDVVFRGVTPITTWYVGLKGTGTPAAADTLASHSTWTEINPYSGNRPAYSAALASAGAITNSASKASYTITSALTVYGAFIASVNTGTSGTLACAANFSTSRAVEVGDTLNVTYALSATSS